MSNLYFTYNSQPYNYLPIPTKAWYRVQNQCTFENDISYNEVYVALTQANINEKNQYKGNVLQYKKNSSSLTKNQRYSQISKGLWSNRTKTFATQSQTYSNPNTTGLVRVNYVTIPATTNLVGYPNNVAGPFQYDVPNPFDCCGNSIQEGGNLVCGTYANPCTGVVTQTLTQSQCNPTYCSDVPGPVINLCWNPKNQTFFPKKRYVMNNSGNKWPQGYKVFQSAIKPVAPTLVEAVSDTNTVTLSWIYNNNVCIPVSSFNLYNNSVLVQTVSYQITSTVIYGLTSNTSYSFYVTAVSNNIESVASNIITTTTTSL
jgi:hypothetical protein